MKLFFQDLKIILVVLLTLIIQPGFSQSSEFKNSDNSKIVLVDSLNTLSAGYRFTNIDSLSLLAHKAYDIASSINYIPGSVEATRLIAIELLIRGEYPDAVEILLNQKLELNPNEYLRETAVVDYYIGVAYSTSGNFKASLPYLNKSLQRFRELNDEFYVLQCLNNIGVCYIRLKKFAQALEIFNEIKAQNNDTNPGLTTTLLVNLGYCYYGLDEFSKAEVILNELFELPESEVDERGYGFAYFKLGEVYFRQNKTEKAIASFLASIAVFDKFKIEQDKIEALNGLAEIYLKQKKYSLAMKYVTQGVEAAENSGNLLSQEQILKTKYRILKAQSKFQEALVTFEKLTKVTDSLVSTQQSAEMGQIIAQYDFNIQRDSLLLKQKELKLENQKTLTEQRLATNITIVILIAVVVLLIVIYRSYQLKIKSNKLLTAKNKEIKNQRDELEQSNKIKNKLISIIGHDLRSPINTLNGLLRLVRNKMANNEDLEIILPKLIDNFDHASNLLNNLLSWTTSQMDGYTLEFTNFQIKDVLNEVIENAKFRLEEKSINCILEGDPASVFAEENMIEIVCQNLLGNAIKFCEAGDTIKIKISVADQVLVSFADSGTGMSAEKIELLLSKNVFSSTKGTNNEKGSGLGLTICKDFLQKNKSHLQIDSEEGKGSTFYFYLPKGK